MGGYNTLFYKKKPLFGLDIGSKTIKIMQLQSSGEGQKLLCYGVGSFDQAAIKDGIIVDYESLASSIVNLYQRNLIGKLTTNRVALTIPISRTFNKVITTPKVKKNELKAAIEAEAEQYIPLALSDLYFDYEIISSKDESTYEVLIVAAPRRVIESYVHLSLMLGLEPAAFDTSITASARIFEKIDEHSDIPSVLIDFGTQSADISIHDKTIVVTNTILGGGDNFTDKIAQGLNVSHREAHIIKTKYGLGKSKKQAEIMSALDEDLQKLVREIRKMLRYYEDRGASDKKIGQIITLGGGANMPGLTEYLIETLRLPVRTHNPWQKVKLGKLQPPTMSERSIYVTAAGLALITEKDIFAS